MTDEYYNNNNNNSSSICNSSSSSNNNDDKSSSNVVNKRKFFVRTVTQSKIPVQLHHPFIRGGYRLANQPWGYYFRSLFQLHNETINIWTQCIGLLFVSYLTVNDFRYYRLYDSPIQWTVLGFGTCCCISLFNSAIAHLLYSKSASVNYIAFMFDYLGAVIWGYGIVILTYYGISSKETHDLIGPYSSKIHMVFAYLNFLNACFYKILFGHNPKNYKMKRLITYGLVLEGICGSTPAAHRYVLCYRDPDCSFASLNHITFGTLSLIIMAIIFSMHIPERFFPGRFDLIGHSHQIFHCLVIFSQLLEFRAIRVDFDSGANAHCRPDIYDMFLWLAILYIMCLISIFLLIPRIQKSLKDENKLE